MQVKDIMTTEVVRVDRNTGLHDIADLMQRHSISCVMVCQNDTPVGIITERDVIRGIGAERRGERAGSEAQHLMSSPVTTVNAETRVHTAAGLAQQQMIRHLPVTDSAGQLVGITTQTDLLRGYTWHLEQLVCERTEELSAAVNKLHDANAAKSQFLANMSHEIRTPMTAILGFTELAIEGDLSAEERRGHLETVRRNGQHLMTLISDLLDLSKAESGEVELEIQPTSPFEMMSAVSLLMRGSAIEKGLTFAVETQGRIPERFPTDPRRLRQILINLLGNAIKFTQTGGVRVILRLQEESESREARLCFEVVDTGCGLTPSQQERIFMPFVQGDASTTRRHGGTGLGLSISCKLAELLGGSIEVRSRIEEGSRFTLTLPIGPLEQVELVEGPGHTLPVERGSVDPPVRLSGRVLLAEDTPDTRMLLRRLLERSGLEVTEAEDGQIALDLALEFWRKAEPFDLILMDMQMPRRDGYQATRRLRQEGYEGSVIALTAHAASTDREKCLQAGCDAYATKPVDRRALLGLLANYLPEADVE